MYETLSSGSPTDMVPAIRNILGGFLFSGDDVYKKVAVLSGGERTRLAVARMLLRPSNTLLLDEPTNHLDLDSKDILLEALEDYGGTLIFVSHDRYFVEKLATKIVEIGHGDARVFPGTYTSSCGARNIGATGATGAVEVPTGAKAGRERGAMPRRSGARGAMQVRRRRTTCARRREPARRRTRRPSTHARKRAQASSASAIRTPRSSSRESPISKARIAEREQAMKEIEAAMSAPGFLRQPRPGTAAHRPPPGADVGAGRPDAPVGGLCRK